MLVIYEDLRDKRKGAMSVIYNHTSRLTVTPPYYNYRSQRLVKSGN